MEIIINNNRVSRDIIICLISANNCFSNINHGFVPSRECVTELLKEGVISELKEIIEECDSKEIAKKKSGSKLVYFDENEEVIWILSHVKMAILLEEYEIAERLLDLGFSEKDSIYETDRKIELVERFNGDNSKNKEYAMQVHNRVEAEDFSIYEFILAKNNLPDTLLNKLLIKTNASIEFENDFLLNSFDYKVIEKNRLEKRIDPKHFLQFVLKTENKQILEQIFFAIGNEELLINEIDNSNLFKAKRDFKSDEKYMFKFKVFSQLELMKNYIEKLDNYKRSNQINIIENEKSINDANIIIVYDNLTNLVEQFNLNYIEATSAILFNYSQYSFTTEVVCQEIKYLLKAREKMWKLCSDYPEIRTKLYMKLLAERSCLKSLLKNFKNYLHLHSNDEEANKKIDIDELQNVINSYERFIESLDKPDNTQKIENLYFEEMTKICGARSMVDKECFYTSIEFTQQVRKLLNKDISSLYSRNAYVILNVWLKKINAIKNFKNKNDVYSGNADESYSSLVDAEYPFMDDPWADDNFIVVQKWTPDNIFAYDEFINLLCKGMDCFGKDKSKASKAADAKRLCQGIKKLIRSIDDENLYVSSITYGFLQDGDLDEIISELIELENWTNIPLLMAYKAV